MTYQRRRNLLIISNLDGFKGRAQVKGGTQLIDAKPPLKVPFIVTLDWSDTLVRQAKSQGVE